MSHRQSFSVGVGITYPQGTNLNANTSGVYYSQSASSKIVAFNGHAVEVYADGAVWDTVNNVYLYPGRDYNLVP